MKKTKISNALRIIYCYVLKHRVQTRVFQSTLDYNCFKIVFDQTQLRIGDRTAVYLHPDTMDESACANHHTQYWKEITWQH